MLDTDGNPLLMDFGLAQFAESESQITRDGGALGTPAYMPPEQAKGQFDQVGPASDQYSLGVVLYELLCEQTPFSGPPSLLISMVINQEPPSPRSIDAQIPKDLETICLKAMARDADARYASCRDLADDFRRWQEGDAIRARRLSPIERAWRWCKRSPVVAALLAAVALVLLLGTTVSSSLAVKAIAERNRADKAADDLHRALKTTKEARDRADKAADDLRRALEDAKEQKELADQHAEREFQARERAERQLQRSELLLYASQIESAQREWRDGEARLAWDYLSACRWDLRGWEHNYLYTLMTPGRNLLGHRLPVRSVAFSPDGRWIVSGSSDKTLKVWHATTGQETLTLKGIIAYGRNSSSCSVT
jgi:serine/threonine protein kinase